MNKDQTLLQEAYKKVQTGVYDWDDWLSQLPHSVYKDGSVSVEGDVELAATGIRAIPFKFREVTGSFDCSNNPHLSSLDGCPEEVGGAFFCDGNPSLTSLEGAPKKVTGSFWCSDNIRLKSIKGLSRASNYYTQFSDEDIKRELYRQELESKMDSETKDVFGDLLSEL